MFELQSKSSFLSQFSTLLWISGVILSLSWMMTICFRSW